MIMNLKKHRIKNPSLTLYAFHLHTDIAESEDSEEKEDLWKNLEKLGRIFDFSELGQLRKKLVYPPDEGWCSKTGLL